jgi:hypothetical protein
MAGAADVLRALISTAPQTLRAILESCERAKVSLRSFKEGGAAIVAKPAGELKNDTPNDSFAEHQLLEHQLVEHKSLSFILVSFDLPSAGREV